MAYSIIEAHVCYDFLDFITNERKRCLFKIKKSNFRHSSYLWLLLAHQNLDKLIKARRLVQSVNPNVAPILIDLMVPILSKLHGSYYEFMYMFYATIVQILIEKLSSRLCKSTMRELQGGNKIDDWYFLRDHTVIIMYGYFEKYFLLPKYVTPSCIQ